MLDKYGYDSKILGPYKSATIARKEAKSVIDAVQGTSSNPLSNAWGLALGIAAVAGIGTAIYEATKKPAGA